MKILSLFGSLILALLSMFVCAYSLSMLYNWFVVAQFGVKPISTFMAYALTLIYPLLDVRQRTTTVLTDADAYKKATDQSATISIAVMIVSLIALGIGKILTYVVL